MMGVWSEGSQSSLLVVGIATFQVVVGKGHPL